MKPNRLTNRRYEKEIRKYFPFFRTIEIRKYIYQANNENICITDKKELLSYINKIIDNDVKLSELRLCSLSIAICSSKSFNIDSVYKYFKDNKLI